MLTFQDSEIKDFINTDIPSYQRGTLLEAINANSTEADFYDVIGRQLTGEGSSKTMLLNTGPAISKSSFWDKVKKEVYIFICTSDKKYKTERNLIGKNFKEVATIIATAIAGTFSLGTGVVVGIVTNILISIVKVNQNAWCELQKENQ
ncbi:hypothetical protein [Carboxylicivirga sp. M1479]|uniref:hypothetical protein n=1 Tax=Carboxylicivirga sp. M1479 TaxID=2594476 RepID=UPI0011775699|nr:hypothetical protein [Carboxylicivirga sp. M1479]TRX72579.1 hypothetical protein FNN09_01180 [Carboxylicivirga sp. M1479]